MLRLPRDLLDAVVAHCRAEHPIEACGVLAGRDGVPERHIPMRNAAASRTRYAMDPDEQLGVWREMDERGERPVVIYHSHTATEAVPSTPDVQYAAEMYAHYVIVSTRGVEPEVRSFRIAVDAGVVAAGVATEELIDVVDAAQETVEWRTRNLRVRVDPDGDLWINYLDADTVLVVQQTEIDALMSVLQAARRVIV